MRRDFRLVTCTMMVLLLFVSNTYAGDVIGGQMAATEVPIVRIRFDFHFDHRGKMDFSFNSLPVGKHREAMNMSCPPPPNSCAPLVGIMLAAGVVSIVFLREMSRSREDEE